ncbi:hypothetical protein [Micromonospora orduensis]|nr:hypothetical protein [Micromonospora orduensis]
MSTSHGAVRPVRVDPVEHPGVPVGGALVGDGGVLAAELVVEDSE